MRCSAKRVYLITGDVSLRVDVVAMASTYNVMNNILLLTLNVQHKVSGYQN